jgi:hypothetical protein
MVELIVAVQQLVFLAGKSICLTIIRAFLQRLSIVGY